MCAVDPVLRSQTEEAVCRLSQYISLYELESTSLSRRRNTETLTTLGCGTRPVSVCSQKCRSECTEYFGEVSVFVYVRSAFGVGGNTPTPERDQKLLHMIQDEILYLTHRRIQQSR